MIFAGFAKLQLDADEEAVARFRRSVELNRNHPRVHFWLAAALAHHHRALQHRRAERQSYLPSDIEAHP
jgi:Flp pilus assembly protein TadD